MSKIKISLKYWLSILLFVILLSVQLVFLVKNRNFEFKYAEYGSIAQSLVHGEGFSSPFYTQSGPTAWMPPFLVYFIYFFFLVFGNGLLTFLLLTIIKFLTYSVSFILLLKTLEYCKIKQSPIVIWLLFILYLFMSIYQNFKTVNDYWLFSLLICLFTYAYIQYKSNGSRKGFFLLIGCFLLAPIISPGLVVSFAAVAVFDYLYGVIRGISVGLNPMDWIRQFFIDCFKNVKSLSQLCLFGLAMIISTFLWTYRNYEVFHTFIPIKSNMWFEFYMSNVIEPKGLLTQTTLIKVHPMTNAVVFQDYARSGEIDWIKKYELVSREYKEKHKEEYHHKIWNRFMNAFVFIEIDDDVISTSICQKISA